MSEHLTAQRISALLEAPWADMDAEGHLEGCEACRSEYERMSRMRMALSALGELEPPAGLWEEIEARLDARDAISPEIVPLREGGAWRLVSGWPVQVAAAFALFAGGWLAGAQLTRDGSGDPLADGSEGLPTAVPVASISRVPANEPEEAYLSALAELEALRSPIRLTDLEREDGTLDPVATAEVLARLNALIEATRAAVEEAPGDPVANGYLFQLVEERSAVTQRLQESTHLASLEDW